MQAATPAAFVRGQSLERFGDETPAVTMLTTTPNDALAHAELVHTYEPPRAVLRAPACSTHLSVALALDQALDDVAFDLVCKEPGLEVICKELYEAVDKAAPEEAGIVTPDLAVAMLRASLRPGIVTPALAPSGDGAQQTGTGHGAVDSEPIDFLRKFLILALCPFLYGEATRLPFIYYVIHLDAHFGDQITETFGSKWFPIGCFVAAYQVSEQVQL